MKKPKPKNPIAVAFSQLAHASMTKKQRQERARKAGNARWAKERAADKARAGA
jgi:hypothetical protein